MVYSKIRSYAKLSSFLNIARRYFILNGFDGLYTMLGIVVGSYVAGQHDPGIVLGTGLAGIVALGGSGFATAFLSESAERKRELKKIEKSMLISLKGTMHDEARKFASVSTALVNGFSPIIASTVMVFPFLLSYFGMISVQSAFSSSIAIAVAEIFLLGCYLGVISGESRTSYGVKMLLIAVATAGLSFIIAGVFK
ncbi:MAG TPA: hypothetical protein ENN13_05505 [Candidatus Altiarchaeales archaeon]|nr:hypothetical protein [Candidatus Altiarchaeales archaeon]